MSSASAHISKTEFLSYLTCPGYAWRARHQPHLLSPPDAGARRRMREGSDLEQLAKQILPPGQTIHTREAHLADSLTREAMAEGESVLFQPTVLTENGLMARADVLIRTDHGWHMIEIKSSSTDPAKPRNGTVKKHLPDITFQTLAFRQAGIAIKQSSLLFLNRTFERNGDICAQDLFVLVDVTDDVHKAHLDVQAQIDDAVKTLLDSQEQALCNCHRKTRANRCDLFHYFHPDIPQRDTVYNIASIHRGPLTAALDRGAMKIMDWPDEIRLSEKQARQVALARSGIEAIQESSLIDFLKSMSEPLWYLDYETFQNAVPPWDGYSPHQQIVFQYSLHRWTADTELEHFEFLAESSVHDPTEALLQQLRSDLGDQGSVVVWNKSFEHGRNVEMAQRYPEYADFLEDANRRMVDLADAVKHGWWESPAFQGSWSLKQVLPVAAPELDYGLLEIGDGGTASEQWMQAVLDSPSALSDTERAGVLQALRVYCAQDTLAMHRIREYIVRLLP